MRRSERAGGEFPGETASFALRLFSGRGEARPFRLSLAAASALASLACAEAISSRPAVVPSPDAKSHSRAAREKPRAELEFRDPPSSAVVVGTPPALPSAPPDPLGELSEEELRRRILTAPETLGAMSFGEPGAGTLLNAVLMPEGAHWTLNDAENTWGTDDTVAYLTTALGAVYAKYPDAHALHIGHISAPRGGHLDPHRSHQNGTDVDLGYFYTRGPKWYARAHAGNLDVERTWALVRELITHTDVRFILIDKAVQVLLEGHARRLGEDAAWLDDLFRGTSGRTAPLIRHARGHATHMHIRFFNPLAQARARRCYPGLVAAGLVAPTVSFLSHRARPGDTLGKLAKRYSVTIPAIRDANHLRSNRIRAGATYRIPRASRSVALPPVPPVPPRRLPPETSTPSPAPPAPSPVAQRELVGSR